MHIFFNWRMLLCMMIGSVYRLLKEHDLKNTSSTKTDNLFSANNKILRVKERERFHHSIWWEKERISLQRFFIKNSTDIWVLVFLNLWHELKIILYSAPRNYYTYSRLNLPAKTVKNWAGQKMVWQKRKKKKFYKNSHTFSN